jgi:glutamate dehydrogenase (NAD(P)+)
MEPLPTIDQAHTVGEAARQLVETRHDMLAVLDTDGQLVGIITDWDITRASAGAGQQDLPLAQIMTRDVISAHPDETILDAVHRLEYHEISAMPVVRDGRAVGVVSGDILARRTLYRLLQAQG